MGSDSSSISFSTTVPICPRTLSLFRSLSCSGVSEFSSFWWTWLFSSNQRSAPDPGRTMPRLPMVCLSIYAVFTMASAAFGLLLPPVALSTKARKTRSRSPACSRLATNGRPLLMDASTAGEPGIP